MLSALLAALWIGPAQSGSWFTPERNGEGFTLQVLDNGTAHALWFTYPPAGSEAQQAWIYASGGRIEGDRIRFEDAVTTRGPRFGASFDPAALRIIPWGTIEFRFTSCNEGEVIYAGPTAWGSGTRRVTRLTALAELECAGKRRVDPQGARTLDGLRNRSGAWFDPAHNGEGWNVEELPDGRAQVYWFTYDELGEQAWTIGVSPTSGERMSIAENLRPVGTRFGTGFDASQVRMPSWGRLELELAGCAQGTVRYESSLASFGSGILRPVRLTTPAGTACIEGTPSVPSAGSYQAGAPEPVPVSESANAVVDGMIYMAGGFGNPRGFKRYDPARDLWTLLPDVPGGRDHALATAIDGSIYVTGGNPGGDGDQTSHGWCYLIAEGRWATVAELPDSTQAGAASLDGFAYFADVRGSLVQFNPRTRATRPIPTEGIAPRDHSRLVAFQGELWLIGGREEGRSETALVSIYDPAAESWRRGPNLLAARAGFAVATSPTLLVVAGGEILFGTRRTLSSVEVIGAGQGAWSALPELPTPLHGFGAIIHGSAFHTVGGTTRAGGVSNPGIVQILRW